VSTMRPVERCVLSRRRRRVSAASTPGQRVLNSPLDAPRSPSVVEGTDGVLFTALDDPDTLSDAPGTRTARACGRTAGALLRPLASPSGEVPSCCTHQGRSTPPKRARAPAPRCRNVVSGRRVHGVTSRAVFVRGTHTSLATCRSADLHGGRERLGRGVAPAASPGVALAGSRDGCRAPARRRRPGRLRPPARGGPQGQHSGRGAVRLERVVEGGASGSESRYVGGARLCGDAVLDASQGEAPARPARSSSTWFPASSAPPSARRMGGSAIAGWFWAHRGPLRAGSARTLFANYRVTAQRPPPGAKLAPTTGLRSRRGELRGAVKPLSVWGVQGKPSPPRPPRVTPAPATATARAADATTAATFATDRTSSRCRPGWTAPASAGRAAGPPTDWSPALTTCIRLATAAGAGEAAAQASGHTPSRFEGAQAPSPRRTRAGSRALTRTGPGHTFDSCLGPARGCRRRIATASTSGRMDGQGQPETAASPAVPRS
jgi:hypothetical protein